MDATAAKATLEGLFDRIDALINKDGMASYEELQAVFGPHADEFLKFCDKDGDKKLDKNEFTENILKDCAEMTQEEFDTNWTNRMEGVVQAAEEKKAAEASDGKRTLVYFAGLRSRGEPCRIVAAYGGVELDNEELTFDQWGERKSEAIPYMPYIKQTDGSILLETEAVLKHLAELGGKFVMDDKTTELAKRANSPPLFLADPYLNMPEPAWATFSLPSKADWIASVIPEYKKLAEELGDGPFFAGEKPGYGEAFIWHNIENGMLAAKAEISEGVGEEDMAKLLGFHERFAALDGVKDYLANRPAKFGAPDSLASTL
jgi:glutathione S-transferase